MQKVIEKKYLEELPNEWQDDCIQRDIENLVNKIGRKVVALDDDPTGTQTVHDVSVVTSWDYETLRDVMLEDGSLFYILTNSRAYTTEEAMTMTATIAENLAQVSADLSIPLEVISRGDSTLRGHYPQEVDVLRETLESKLNISYDGEIIAPFFLEGGRLTINDIHWVRDGKRLIPAGDTEFAKDTTFGYSSSSLKDWIEEKTKGKYPADKVISITIDDIRLGGPRSVCSKLISSEHGTKFIVNSATYKDMEVFVMGLLQAEEMGKNFLFRTAASFVRVRGGIKPKGLLTKNELLAGSAYIKGGLVVVGSHVAKTGSQLEFLVKHSDVYGVELDVKMVVKESSYEEEIMGVRKEIEDLIKQGRNVVMYTSREVIKGRDDEENMKIGKKISSALVKIVEKLEVPLRYLVAKGGITSSDIGTKALKVKKAEVLGQILPGIPVWKLDKNHKFPYLPYIIFPGNVGNKDSLAQVVDILSNWE